MTTINLEVLGNFLLVTDLSTNVETRFSCKDTYYNFESLDKVLVLTWDKNNGTIIQKYNVNETVDVANSIPFTLETLDIFLSECLGFKKGGTAPSNITLSGAITGSGTTSIETTLANSIIGVANLTATGTPNATTYLRGDNTWATIAVGGGGLEGTNYIYVAANGTSIENATELQTAYNLAKTLTPTATNRITIIAGVGYYNLQANFVMDTPYIDLVSLDGNRSIILNNTSNILRISSSNVFVKGVDSGNATFRVEPNLSNIKVENCKAGPGSFGGNPIWDAYDTGTNSGTFIDCIGGEASFGDQASGTFIRCTGGSISFGLTASGIFIDCTGTTTCFGVSLAPGTFTRCTSGNYGYGGTASGIFTNCIGGTNSFGNESSGVFTNCIGGTGSFGATTSLTGKLYYCRLSAGTFTTVTSPGTTVYCIDGSNNTNNQ